MKIVALLMLWLLSGFRAGAQDEVITLDDLRQSAEEWAKENLDDDVLRALQSADQAKVKRLLADLQQRLQGEYVINLAALKDTAKALIPLLERYEESLPYALWLKTQLDYLEAADQFRLIIPPPKTPPGQPAKPAPNPTPQQESTLWLKRLAQRPWPENSKSYAARLKPIFAAQKAPPQLVWLAEVESSFDPRARSPAGAAGLFQLMPATAKRFGLRRWPVDQRLNPEESARAAAKYLYYLHDRFRDWRLALAAYNAGEGAVSRLCEKYHAGTFDALAPHLPAETQMYVPRIEATLLRREGISLTQL